MIDREAIYIALFAKLAAVPGFVTYSRRLRHWTDVAANEQPALFLTAGKQVPHTQPIQHRGLPTVWRIESMIYIYGVTSDISESPSSILNPLMDAVQAALAPDDLIHNVMTLGGLVDHCWITGPVINDEGLLGGQGVIMCPVEMLVTA